ncbi:MAG TPA: hypothetical protein VGL22_20865 [Terracidiphilus sp.]
MHLTINNQDYTMALDASAPLAIERTLNAPSVCRFSLALPSGGSLASPARFQHIEVAGDEGSIYFTGYIAATPQPEYAGMAMEGAQYRLLIHAVSEEILLDQAAVSGSKGASGLTAGALLANVAAHTGSSELEYGGLTLQTRVSHFTPDPGAPFSKSAGQIASQARAAYRAHAGKLVLNSIPTAVHSLDEADGSLTLANLTFTRNVRRDLANDITVCGLHEPAAYVTEVFVADGLTNSFVLADAPYFPPASKANILAEGFDEPGIDTRNWSNPSGNTFFGLGASGLIMRGGNGIDGETQLTWLDPVEMAGTLLLEAAGVKLAAESAGLLAAFFSGDVTSASCFAGFQATAQPGTGGVSLQAVVCGSACGPTVVLDPDHEYTLRIRVHSPEQQSARAMYLSFGDAGLIALGGQIVFSPARLQLEIQEFVNGVASMPVCVYEGDLSNLPASCSVLAASSIDLHGSMRALSVSSLGSAWVMSKASDGTLFTRRLGTAAQSAECAVERSGHLVFTTGVTPAAGEQITVWYRAVGRSVGRAVANGSQQTLPPDGSYLTLAWIGSVTNPAPRSSADCRNAAAALLASSTSSAALWSGMWRGNNLELQADVWPGDALALNVPSCHLDTQVVVRRVKLVYGASTPDLVTYEVDFANDWIEDLAIRASDSVPSDTWLPVPAAPAYAANLNALRVTAISGNNVSINTGSAAPGGGGFEIRNRDHAFMPGEDSSLVMRGSQPNLTFTRRSASDRFYVRMFDGADPPNYSEFSAVLVLNMPLSA